MRLPTCLLTLLLAGTTAVARPLPSRPPSSVDAGAEFSWKFAQAAMQPAGNLVCSPYSLREAAALVAYGAAGPTGTQLRSLLAFPADDAQLLDQVSGQRQALAAVPGLTWKDANALVVDSGFPLRSDYKNTLQRRLGALVESLDFSKPASLRRVNQWCSRITGGKIDQALETLDGNAVLLNAVYLKTSWTTPFPAYDTHPQPFQAPKGLTNVPMMHLSYDLLYGRGPDCSVVEVPYASGDIVFDCLLPDKADGLAAFVRDLSWPALQARLDELTPHGVDLQLPRFSLRTDHLEALPLLGRLGWPDHLDLQRISPAMNVSEVLQSATVDLDEKGTEATAVTAVISRGGPSASEELPRAQFHADHPFVFLIRNRRDGTLLFIGQLVQPAPMAASPHAR